MTLPTWDDIDVFLAEFGVRGTWTNGEGEVSEILVIFDHPNSTITMGNVELQSALPTARAKTEDLGTVDDTCTLVIDDVTYHVRDSNSDATGMTVLELSKDETT